MISNTYQLRERACYSLTYLLSEPYKIRLNQVQYCLQHTIKQVQFKVDSYTILRSYFTFSNAILDNVHIHLLTNF